MDEFDQILTELQYRIANANHNGQNSEALTALKKLHEMMLDVQKLEERLITLGRVAHG